MWPTRGLLYYSLMAATASVCLADTNLHALAQRWETAALGDPNMRTLQKGDVIQLERKGYYIVDAPLIRPGQAIVLLSIPDGRQKSASAPPAAKPAAVAATSATAAAPAKAVQKAGSFK